MKQSLGLLEVRGLALAIEVADAMVKSASVTLLGVEKTKGGGWMLVQILGDVASVQSAITTGAALAARNDGLVSQAVLARPDAALLKMMMPPSPDSLSTGTPDAAVCSQKPSLERPAHTDNDQPAASLLPVVTDMNADRPGTGMSDAVVSAESSGSEASIPVSQAAMMSAPHPIQMEKTGLPISDTATCNLCHDPSCPRQKGEPRRKCIHAGDLL